MMGELWSPNPFTGRSTSVVAPIVNKVYEPRSSTSATVDNQLISTLDEKWRRVFAGFWATVYGRGGIERLTIITGMSRTTIRRVAIIPMIRSASTPPGGFH